MNFAEIIVNRRKALGLTQEGLAQKLGVTNQAVSKWESGQSCPDIALLPALADIFGITLDQLFSREPKAVSFPAQPPFPWPDDGVLRVLLYAGHTRVYGPVEGADEIHFCYEGPARNIDSAVHVTCDDVFGNIQAGGTVNCDDVKGNVSANGSVNHGKERCGNVDEGNAAFKRCCCKSAEVSNHSSA